MASSPKHVARTQKSPARKPGQSRPRPLLRVIEGGGISTAPVRSAPNPTRTEPKPKASTRKARSVRRRPGVAFYIASSAVIAAGVFGLVLLNILVAQSSFKLADLHSDVAKEETRYRQMRFEVAKAESPARVAEVASTLGLRAPERQEYILGRPVTSPAPPALAENSLSDDKMKAVLGTRP